MKTGHRFIRLSGGTVHVRLSGGGRPLLMLHSNGLSWHESAAVIERLEADHEVIAWDMPGQGDSDPIPWDLSIDDYADTAAELLTELEVEPALVVGTSVGAFIAMSLARRRPDLVAGLCLIEFQFAGPAWFAANWETVERLFAVPTMSRDAVDGRLVHPSTDALFARWNIDRNKAGSRSMMGVMRAIGRYDVAEAVRAIETPVVAVFGNSGPTAANASAVEACLDGRGRVELVADAGHFVSIDQPGDLARIVRGLSMEL